MDCGSWEILGYPEPEPISEPKSSDIRGFLVPDAVNLSNALKNNLVNFSSYCLFKRKIYGQTLTNYT